MSSPPCNIGPLQLLSFKYHQMRCCINTTFNEFCAQLAHYPNSQKVRPYLNLEPCFPCVAHSSVLSAFSQQANIQFMDLWLQGHIEIFT